MGDNTSFYGLSTLTAGDSVSDNSYKYSEADRQKIDRLLKLGAELHAHTGVAAPSVDPALPPALTLDTNSGGLQAGVRIYYKFTLVDSSGAETAASPESYIDTPTQVSEPLLPGLSYAAFGGGLVGGNYFYVLSAYSGTSTQETLAKNTAFITLPTTSSSNAITLELPTTPSNADGFNVYRRSPGSNGYFFIASIDMTGGSPPSSFVDYGYSDVVSRNLPAKNTTFNTNTVTVSYPGATPVVPDGYTWKIYRTFQINNYTKSTLKHVVEEISPGVIDTDYPDVGNPTLDGIPPSASQLVGDAPKIDMSTSVEGRLPAGQVNVYPHVVIFDFDDLVTTGDKVKHPWICPFPRAYVDRVDAILGYEDTNTTLTTVAGAQVLVKVDLWPSSVPTFPTQVGAVSILNGESVGADTLSSGATPNVTGALINQGDALMVTVVEGDEGATPTAKHLRVEVSLMTQFDTTSVDTDDWS